MRRDITAFTGVGFLALRSKSADKRIDSAPPAKNNPVMSLNSLRFYVTRTLSLVALFVAGMSTGVFAAENNVGIVEGRVSSQSSGEYLERARISVDGLPLETFTDADGFYRLTNVPATVVQLKAFFTGLSLHTANVTVLPGQVVTANLSLGSPAQRTGETVKLSEFIVGESREMAGSAIAINEQRFAPNVKNVVATDEFGFVPEANVAEFLKYVPGVTIDNQGGNGRWISINGVPTDYVPVTVNGFSLASTGGDNAANRAVEVDMVSINTLSRIEVAYSPTPETQGAALAGSVNMIARSAFERAKPVLNFSAYLMMRDNSRDFKKTPGPYREPTRKVRPGFDFSYVAPVNDRFGYTVTGGTSSQYSWEISSINTWRGTSAATNGVAFPNTTPDRPYLSTYAVADRPKFTWRNALGATFDYKLTRNDRLSLSLQGSSFEEQNTNRTLTFNVGRVQGDQFGPAFTHGAAGGGSLQQTAIIRNRVNQTFMPTLTWRHDGPVWRSDAGVGVSHQSQHYRDIDKGFFRTVTLQRTGVTVSFDDNYYLRPGRITVTDATGTAPVDPYNLANYSVTQAISDWRDSTDVQHTAYANLARDLTWKVPITLKTGVDIRRSMRDLRGGTPPYVHVGRDGRSSTSPVANDDAAAPFLNPNSLARPGPFGFPMIQWVDPLRVWEYYGANPTNFTRNPNTDYRTQVGFSKHAEQLITAAFLRGDLQLLESRLKLVGGVRAEQTNIKAEGPLNDPTRNFQRDASGQVLLGANRQPLLIATDPLEASMRTYIDRGQHTEKEYLRWFPSLNASYNLRENLVMRAAYYFSVGRPDYNQYAGGITLPNTETGPAPNNVITINNVGVKAWSSRSANVRLEYYFSGVGLISAGVFRREIRDFFDSVIIAASPDFLAANGIDPGTYGNYDVATQQNLSGAVRMEGFDVNYKQALTFLPNWARGVQIFANGNIQRVTGEAADNFAGYIPKSASWGFSFTRPKYNVRANWNFRGRQRRGAVAPGLSIEPGTYNYSPQRLNIDLLGEYYVWRRFAVFANLRNLRDQPEEVEVYGPHTPESAQFRQRTHFGSLWTVGVKGTF
jgi:iron complex outermembrane recepter protein